MNSDSLKKRFDVGKMRQGLVEGRLHESPPLLKFLLCPSQPELLYTLYSFVKCVLRRENRYQNNCPSAKGTRKE
jgi:hypothetical protein